MTTLKERYANDPEYRERKKAIAKRSRDKNKERARGWAQGYRESHRESVNQAARDWYNAKSDDERKEYASSKYYKNLIRTMFGNAKSRANRQGIPFSISKDDIIIPDVCPVLNIPITWNVGMGRMNDNSPSLDKIIPELGYVPGNVCVISWRANRLKSDATLADLESVCDYIRRSLPA